MFGYFDTIPACDRRTDRQKDILRQHSLRYAYASRGKTVANIFAMFFIQPSQLLGQVGDTDRQTDRQKESKLNSEAFTTYISLKLTVDAHTHRGVFLWSVSVFCLFLSPK